jgi:hypothetical protein
MTPPALARALVRALQPSGTILEPCAGTGNFVKALRPYGQVSSCEIDRGADFLAWTEHVDWIVTNPRGRNSAPSSRTVCRSPGPAMTQEARIRCMDQRGEQSNDTDGLASFVRNR